MMPSRILRALTRLMLIEEVRSFVGWLRFIWYARIRGKVETLDPENGAVATNTVSHNLRGLRRSVTRNARTNTLIRPLSAIPKLQWRLAEATVLSVGPRGEGELLNLAAHGFRWANITGLDLITYSPRIRLGDMHAMPFDDATFDVVVASRVLGYSEEPARAAAEFVRVTKPGGFIAINTGDSIVTRERTKALDYRPGAQEKLASLDALLSLFGEAVGHVSFRNDPARLAGEHRGPILVIFEVAKPGP